MKKGVFLLISIFYLSLNIHAQKKDNVIRIVACKRDYLDPIKDSLKKLMVTRGFLNVIDTNFNMESGYETFIPLPLRKGTNYWFYFISEPFTRYSEVRMYDYEENQIASIKNGWAEAEGNIIGFGHVAEKSEWHILKPVQGFKKRKDMCGYFMVFKKVK